MGTWENKTQIQWIRSPVMPSPQGPHSHSLSQMSSSHCRGSSHSIPTLLGGYLHTLEAPQNGASLLYAEKPALLAAGRN